VESGKFKDRPAADTAIGDQLGAGGTPHYFVNTTVFGGAQNFTEMKPAVDKALE